MTYMKLWYDGSHQNNLKIQFKILIFPLMLLLYPPVAKPCEPPAGIAQLAGFLKHHNHTCDTVDLNIEGLLFLLSSSNGAEDTWSRRAYKNLERNLQHVRSQKLFASPSRYMKIVLEINRVLEITGSPTITASLSNYQDNELSPLESHDLLHIAEKPEKSLFFPFFKLRLPKLISECSPKYIGISLNYLSQALNTFALLGYIKTLAPQTSIVVGGGLITSWMRNPNWKNPFAGLIDHLIDGCGEVPLLQFMGGTATQSQALPDYSSLPRDSYLSPGFILPYSASTGCFWNKCSFCPEVAESNPYHAKPPAKVVEEINELQQLTDPVLLHFLDNAISPAVFHKLIETPPALPWYGFARVSHDLTDPEFCLALKKSGCVMLKLGIESGSQRVLDAMEKGLNIATITTALKNLKSAGIATYVYLLFGTPGESRQEAQHTLQFVIDHHENITFLNLAIFNMPVNSTEKQSLEVKSFYDGDLSLYSDFRHPLGWNRKEVRRFLDQEFKRQPEIAQIVRRDPAIFTSNHAPFFCNPKHAQFNFSNESPDPTL